MKTPNLFSQQKQKLSDSEQDFFQNQITDETNSSSFDFLIKTLENIHGMKCPHCGSEKVMKNGRLKNKTPRFLCNNCHKGYSLYTGTYLQNIKKKDKLFEYIPLRMSNDGTLRFCSQILGISLDTSFEWNKKIFGSLQDIVPDKMEGIVELIIVQETISRKGERIEGSNNFKPSNPDTLPKKKYKKALKLVKPDHLSDNVQIAVSFSRKGYFDLKVIQLGELEKAKLKQNLYSKTLLSDKNLKYYILDCIVLNINMNNF